MTLPARNFALQLPLALLLVSFSEMRKVRTISPDLWVSSASRLADRDLRPCYAFWGWDLSADLDSEVSTVEGRGEVR